MQVHQQLAGAAGSWALASGGVGWDNGDMLFWFGILAEEAQQPTSWLPPQYRVPLVLGALALLLSLFFLRRVRQRVALSQRGQQPSAQERVQRMTSGQDLHGQINEHMVQLAELSRQVNGQLNMRLARLELLLAEADRAINRLEAASGKTAEELLQARRERQAGAGGAADATGGGRPTGETLQETWLGAGTPGAGAAGSSGQVAVKEEFKTVGPVRKAGPATTHEGVNGPAGRPQDGAGVASASISPEQARVVELAEKGLSAVEIARELHRPVGEIELILALNEKKMGGFDTTV